MNLVFSDLCKWWGFVNSRKSIIILVLIISTGSGRQSQGRANSVSWVLCILPQLGWDQCKIKFCPNLVGIGAKSRSQPLNQSEGEDNVTCQWWNMMHFVKYNLDSIKIIIFIYSSRLPNQRTRDHWVHMTFLHFASLKTKFNRVSKMFAPNFCSKIFWHILVVNMRAGRAWIINVNPDPEKCAFCPASIPPLDDEDGPGDDSF